MNAEKWLEQQELINREIGNNQKLSEILEKYAEYRAKPLYKAINNAIKYDIESVMTDIKNLNKYSL